MEFNFHKINSFFLINWSSLVVWTNMDPKYRKNIMHYYYHELLYCSIPKNILINYQTFIWKHSSIFLTSIESFNYLSTYTIIQIWKKNGVILFYSTKNKSCQFCKIIFLEKNIDMTYWNTRWIEHNYVMHAIKQFGVWSPQFMPLLLAWAKICDEFS
jgi:hypothetical protein